MNSFWRGKMRGIACAMSVGVLGVVLGNHPITPVSAWKLAHFTSEQVKDGLADDQAAPNGDGVPNLYKYAMGVSPWENVAAASPVALVENGRLCLRYRKVVGATDVSYRTEAASDLLDWGALPPGSARVDDVLSAGGFITVVESDAVPMPTAGRRFIRLVVERINSDVDDDGMPDDWEIRFKLSPFTDDAGQDADGDGVSNLSEYVAGTDPTVVDRSGFPKILLWLSDRVDFESAEGYAPGPVVGQNGWLVRWGDGADVEFDVNAPSGDQVLAVESGTAVQRLVTPFADEVLFVQYDAQFVSGTHQWNAAHFIAGHTRVFAIRDGGSAEFWVGTHGSWYDEYLNTPTGVSIPVDPETGVSGWHRITMRVDRGSETRLPAWDLYIDGRLVGHELYYNTDIQPFLELSNVEVLKVDNRSDLVARVDRYLLTTENPLWSDVDCDGLPDSYETSYGLNPAVNDRLSDADGDSLSNVLEYALGTNPALSDTDGDGLKDGWEIGYGYDPLVRTDGALDEDEDGLNLLAEQREGADPWNIDSDGDLLTDGEELAAGTSPVESDVDVDGLTDFIEVQIGTDPENADTDGDGMPDGWEVANGLDPLSAGDSARDDDGDGVVNVQEYRSRTSPASMDSNGDGVPDYSDDSDQDGLSNGVEIDEHGTDPFSRDSDGDGMDDRSEIADGRNPGVANESAKWITRTETQWDASYGYRYDGEFRGFNGHDMNTLDLYGFERNDRYSYEEGPMYNALSFWGYFYRFDGERWITNDPYLKGLPEARVSAMIHSNYWAIFSGAYGALGLKEGEAPNHQGILTATSASFQWGGGAGIRGVLSDPVIPQKYMVAPAGSSRTDWQDVAPSGHLHAGSYQASTYRIQRPAGCVDPIKWVVIFTPHNDPENKEYFFYSWTPTTDESPEFQLEPRMLNQAVYGSYEAHFYQANLCADVNRDGRIVPPIIENSGNPLTDRVTATEPFRFWVNDDDDQGDDKRSAADDLPLLESNSSRDSENTIVDGIRDLEDFFPVYLDIKQLLSVLPLGTGGISYHLKQEDSALGVVFTNYTRAQAFEYLRGAPAGLETGFGPTLTQKAGEATVTKITAAGVDISTPSPAFFDRIKNHDGGVLLVEASKATNKPLVLEVRRGSDVITEIKLHLKVDYVETMFSYVNLRSCAHGTVIASTNQGPGFGTVTPTAAPNDPFTVITGGRKNLVFVHGYNVNADGARGASATAFKRFYWSGSKAKFYAVLWRGDDGQGAGIAPASATPDYHRNVGHAWQQGPLLRDFLVTLQGDTAIMAHSLGNMVTKVALTRVRDSENAARLVPASKPATVKHYFAVDAAVPLEATSADEITATSKGRMRHAWWSEFDTQERLWPTEWYALFAGTDDGREGLTWRNVFANLEVGTNFYSSGEEVLANPVDDGMPLWEPLFFAGLRAWVAQEKIKGGNGVAAFFFRSKTGGWSDNEEWYIERPYPVPDGVPRKRRRFVSEAQNVAAPGGVPTSSLANKPFFLRFQGSESGDFYPGYQGSRLHAPIGDVNANDESRKLVTVAKCLAEAIPALSYPQGSNPASGFIRPGMGGNFNLNDDYDPNTGLGFKNGWPTSRPRNDWLHSDCLDVSYIFHFRFYDRMKINGGL